MRKKYDYKDYDYIRNALEDDYKMCRTCYVLVFG
jgi:hypothetical protein